MVSGASRIQFDREQAHSQQPRDTANTIFLSMCALQDLDSEAFAARNNGANVNVNLNKNNWGITCN